MKNFFRMYNDIFLFRLDPYEFMIYSYLVSCAGSKGECWPSYKTMERKLGISVNTIMERIDSLASKRLIDKETRSSKGYNGKSRTSNNHYHIRPIEEAWDYATRFKPIE